MSQNNRAFIASSLLGPPLTEQQQRILRQMRDQTQREYNERIRRQEERKRQIEDEEDDEEDEEGDGEGCPICMRNYNNNTRQKYTITTCPLEHPLCRQCARRIVQRARQDNQLPRCPMCRSRFQGIEDNENRTFSFGTTSTRKTKKTSRKRSRKTSKRRSYKTRR